jgi:hypothetical protein
MMNRDFPDGKQFRTFTPLVSLYGESDLSSIISNYSDEVWFRELMQLMVDGDGDAHDLVMK